MDTSNIEFRKKRWSFFYSKWNIPDGYTTEGRPSDFSMKKRSLKPLSTVSSIITPEGPQQADEAKIGGLTFVRRRKILAAFASIQSFDNVVRFSSFLAAES